MKIIITLIMCSYTTGECMPPYQHPTKFTNMYDCLNFGYKEALRKSEEIGKEEVNKHGIYIRFACAEEKGKPKIDA